MNAGPSGVWYPSGNAPVSRSAPARSAARTIAAKISWDMTRAYAKTVRPKDMQTGRVTGP